MLGNEAPGAGQCFSADYVEAAMEFLTEAHIKYD